VTVLPSSAAGVTTEAVGFFELAPAALVHLLSHHGKSKVREPGWSSLGEAAEDLIPSAPSSREAVVPVGSWSLYLSNGPLGTDVTPLPGIVAKDFGVTAIRAVCVPDDGPGYPARILEVYGPAGDPNQGRMVRVISAIDDGGRWDFMTAGAPFAFEDVERYAERRIRDRFPAQLLYTYLRELGVPYDDEPDWTNAVLLERRGARRYRKRPEYVGAPVWAQKRKR
jgi:hypothetical protein